MRIHALTTCVNYDDHLWETIERWLDGCSSITVVTSLADDATRRVAGWSGGRVRVHSTDLFYAGGAAFNKGAAMEEARRSMPWEEWILFFDVDCLPPADWIDVVRREARSPDRLYGARRRQWTPGDPKRSEALPLITTDGVGVGFFQLFHSSDPAAAGRPLLETYWPHAGNYDNGFLRRWPRDQRTLLPLDLIHLEQPGQWCGRGRDEAMMAMLAERERRGGEWKHERMAEPPRIAGD